MDSRLIDVAIGLALVFAIASLMATALQEIWTQMASGRGRYLHQAIVSFVGDHPGFANELLRHPLIVSLSRKTKDQNGLPSYISSDVMVSALMGTLVKSVAGGIRPGAPRDLVAALQAATSKGNGSPNLQLPGSELSDALTTLAQGVEVKITGNNLRG